MSCSYVNIKLIISYDGSNYHGWQRQRGKPTVQGILENTLKKMLAKIKVTGAGRTDAGAHALGQVANFHVDKLKMPVKKLRTVLNNLLPEDIRILEASSCPLSFDSRRSAKGKTYIYLVCNSEMILPFFSKYSWHMPVKLNINKMIAAGACLAGTHDFASFMSSGSSVKTTIRTIKSIRIVKDDPFITFCIRGNGFLKQMVRSIVGSLVEVGLGKMTPNEFKGILAKKDRTAAGRCAPAKGLFLLSVEY